MNAPEEFLNCQITGMGLLLLKNPLIDEPLVDSGDEKPAKS